MEKIKLDLVPSGKMPSLHASQYDDGREHGIDLFENGVAYKLDGTETLTINERKGDDFICSLDIENTFADTNHIVFASTEQMCAVWGNNICELVIAKGEKTIGTLNFILEIEQSPTEGGIESESEIKNLERQIEEITEEVIGDNYYTKTQTDEAIATAIEDKADTTYVDTELAKKADKTDTYTKTQVNNALNNKMDKANPAGTGSFSLNRKAFTTVGNRSVTVGDNNEASGNNSFAEGQATKASGSGSHAEGYHTVASNFRTHAEGYNTQANGTQSHAEGYYSEANGASSHAEGYYSEANGASSHAEGTRTIANHKSQHVLGEFNIPDDSTATADNKGNYVEIVGNGTSSNARSNARTLDWQGNETLAGDLTYNGNKSLTSEISRIDGRIDNLPAPMIFKGTLGVGGTIQTLPAASASNEGYTYKVITDGTYAGQTAKVGDVFTSNGSAWVLIPSGDEDNDTWRAIKINGTEKLSNAISSGAVDFEQGDNITITFDAEGNKIIVATTGIYTKAEVDALLASKCDYPTETASGTIASFNTDLASALKECEVSFTAYQASGTPTPSTPIPISGFSSATVVDCGINLWDEQWEVGYISVLDGTNSNSQINIRSKNYIPIKPNVSLYLKANIAIVYCPIIFYDKDKNFISSVAQTLWNRTITTPENAYYMRFYMHDSYGTTYGNDISINYPSSDTTYHAYNGTSVVIPFGDTYYGGVLDVIRGKLRVTHEYKDLGSFTWVSETSAVSGLFRTSLTSCKWQSAMLCSAYKYSSVTQYNQINDLEIALTNSEYLPLLRCRNTAYDTYTATQFKNAVTGVQLVYELATPIEIDITPEVLSTISGDNNVFCDIPTSSVEVAFKVSIEKYINDLLNP